MLQAGCLLFVYFAKIIDFFLLEEHGMLGMVHAVVSDVNRGKIKGIALANQPGSMCKCILMDEPQMKA